MRIRPFLFPLALAGSFSAAQDVSAPAAAPAPAIAAVNEDLLAAPQAFRDFVIKKTLPFHSWESKTDALAKGMFGRVEDGGLGLTYANDRTRTVAEVWRDRKANCISITAFYAAACKVMGVSTWFADAPSISLWVRHGSLIYNERHVVAAIPVDALTTLVADFSPQIHSGTLHVRPMSESRFRALFHSNRAIEILQDQGAEAALPEAEAAVRDDDRSGVGWNTLGVVQQALGHSPLAEKAFLKALDVDPENGIACGNLEGLYRSNGRESDADHFRNLGLILRDRDPYFHAFLAREALNSGQTDQALEQIKRALKLQRMEPDFYLILAQAQLDRGERGAARDAVAKAIRWSLPDQRKRMESKLAMIQGQS